MVKVLHVFGLQTKVRKDINEWLDDLFKTFAYLSNKNNEEYKENALRVLDILLNKTDHNSYFTKLNFVCKEKFKRGHNYTLHLVVLTWLRQLQQFFSAQKERDTKGDWNKYGKYWGTSSLAKIHLLLTSINMAQANRDQQTPVDNISFFLPDKEKKGVCIFLEEWAAQILKPNISTALDNAMTDSKTKTRFGCAKKPEAFKITEVDYKMMSDEEERGITNHTYNTSPDQNKNKPKEELILNISTTIKNLLTKANAKQKRPRKLRKGSLMVMPLLTKLLHLF